MAKVFTFRVDHIIRIVDGDSVIVMLDRGFDDLSKKPVRLNGIDAPENHTTTKDACGVVMVAMQKWFDARKGNLSVLSYEWDKFGRVLGDFCPTSTDAVTNGQTLCEYLLENKLVRAYRGEKKTEWTKEQLDAVRAFKA